MTEPVGGPGSGPDHSDEAAAGSVLTGAVGPVDRAAAFSATSSTPPVPRKFVYWVLAGAAFLGLGGLLFEHLFSSAGLNPVPTPVAKTPTTATTIATPAAVPSGRSTELSAPLPSFMGLSAIRARAAPAFSLTDQSGQPFSLAGQKKAVVLTFFNGTCDDICPVLAAEIRQADADLGAAAANVEFVTVNTDPSALAVSGLSAAENQSGLGTLSNWHILTGSLTAMNAVWKSYDISISVAKQGGVEAHNEAIYFIDPAGRERDRATPFADESRTGTYSLPPAQVARWGNGIATYADRLTGP
jgi:cytochrome oxidase Cu insertion factor (SCO1/SenC/PrrC family)